ncbi:uncharacterized protein LOC100882895 [Megachile rotundata]|uniref:uncharacterized protein LOC100882895 n=1 Tax=Megachile rotundata TaxID=143995 RepID=UPI003FD1EE25
MIKSSVLCVFSQVLILGLIITHAGGQSDCVSPNGVAGRCIGIRQCPQLLALLQSVPLTTETANFLRQSGCGFEGSDPLVCCTENRNNNFETLERDAVSDPNAQYNFSNNPLLPSDCGKDLSSRIIGGERTDIDEFPWMTLLIYRKPNGHTAACGGTLINQRYVLTAAHCVKGKDIPKSWRLDSVRLGEYDTNSNPDCVTDGEDGMVCADAVVNVGIEEQISHEKYDPLRRDQRYDIALLRLNRDVQFTNYIKPICLPPTASMGRKLFVAGWGKTETGYSSNVKLKVSVPLVDEEQCKNRYNSVRVPLGFGQICAGGQSGKDSCTGDSGGPLMTMERRSDGNGRWVVVGVVSFGPSPCGMLNWPGVYTKVIDYVPWILSKLRAYVDIVVNLHLKESQCYTPQNKVGTCINIHQCQPLIERLTKQQPVTKELRDYLISLQCGFEGINPKVCCEQQTSTGTSNVGAQAPDPPNVANHVNLRLLNDASCGPVPQQKIVGGKKTGVFDFPWMALLSYSIAGNKLEFRCGGSLINKRYVLTAAHCVTGLKHDMRLVGVRLGEHDFSTERDCDKEADGVEVVCAEKYQDFGIESVHSHSRYLRDKLQNDIALIRLDRDADLRPESVRPICMPIGTAATLTKTKVVVTGWGITGKPNRNYELLQVQLPVVDINTCAKKYEKRVQVWYKQMCAGGNEGKDSCNGDSGGPLQALAVYNGNVTYVQYGIVSFGQQNCGTAGFPGVYTKVVYYMDWILDTIRE